MPKQIYQEDPIENPQPTDWFIMDDDTADHLTWKQSRAEAFAAYVRGPASATDNALARFDSTTGKLLKNSVVTLDDSGNLTGLTSIRTTQGSSDSVLFEAWDVNNAVYRTFITLRAALSPTLTIAEPADGSLHIDGGVMGGGTPIIEGTFTSLYGGNFHFVGNILSVPQLNLESQTSGISAQLFVNNATFDIYDSSNTLSTPLRLFNAAGSFATGFKAGNPVATTVYTLPIAFPGSTQALVSSNTGVMSFQALTSGTVTSITSGTNLTGGTITTSGTIALSATLTGLTSIGVGNLSISGSTITDNIGAPINLAAEQALITGSLGASGEIRLGHSTGGGYKGFKSLPEGSTFVWTLPPENVEHGLLKSNDPSGELSFTLTPSNLTSINFAGLGGGLTISEQEINSGSSLSIRSGTGEQLNLIATDGGAASCTSGGLALVDNSANPHGASLLLTDPTGMHFIVLRAGTPSASVAFDLPPVNVTNGILQSNALSEWHLTDTPVGLTSLEVGNFSLSGSTLSTSSGPTIFAFSNNKIELKNGADAAELKFFNAAGDHYTALISGNSSVDTGYILPITYPTGTQALVSDNTGVMSWASFGGSPLTTKGDIYTYSTVDTRQAAGADGTILMYDSAQTTGLKSFDLSTFWNYPATFCQGWNLSYNSATVLTVGIGIVKSLGGTSNIVGGGYSLDFTTNGENGLDTGSFAANTIYSIFAIRKSAGGTVASLASTSITGIPDVLPSGYDEYRQIGWWVSNAIPALIRLDQTGLYNEKTYNYVDVLGGVNRVLTSGAATTATSVDCSAFVPFGCRQVVLQCSLVPTVLNAAVSLRNSDYVVSPFPYKIFTSSLTAVTGGLCVPITLGSSRNFDYIWDTAAQALTVDIMSFVQYV